MLGRHFENKPVAKEGGQGGSAGKIDDNTAKMLAEVIHKVVFSFPPTPPTPHSPSGLSDLFHVPRPPSACQSSSRCP